MVHTSLLVQGSGYIENAESLCGVESKIARFFFVLNLTSSQLAEEGLGGTFLTASRGTLGIRG